MVSIILKDRLHYRSIKGSDGDDVSNLLHPFRESKINKR